MRAEGVLQLRLFLSPARLAFRTTPGPAPSHMQLVCNLLSLVEVRHSSNLAIAALSPIRPDLRQQFSRRYLEHIPLIVRQRAATR